MFKIPLFGLSSVFYTSCTKKEPYLFIGKTHKFKNCLNLMTLVEIPATDQSFVISTRPLRQYYDTENYQRLQPDFE